MGGGGGGGVKHIIIHCFKQDHVNREAPDFRIFSKIVIEKRYYQIL